MQIIPVSQLLEPEGVTVPNLNALVPDVNNYDVFMIQPEGHIIADASGVRHVDSEQAYLRFSRFLEDAVTNGADIALTPEYSMPWKVLLDAIEAGKRPAAGKLWVFGCESINQQGLLQAKNDLSSFATFLHESLDGVGDKFLNPLVYVFEAPASADDGEKQLVVLCQFKTYPMGDPDHFEVNGMHNGTNVYQFGGSKGQEIRLTTLICSDALAFYDDQAQEVYDRSLILHIQLNPKPRHSQFRQYRERLLQFKGDATEIICLNWARNVCCKSGLDEANWKNISGSAWYLKPDKFDTGDSVLSQNHDLGLYYTWLKHLRVHAMFCNYDQACFLLKATKVDHIGVAAALSRRRGPQLQKRSIWSDESTSWVEQQNASDGFEAIVAEADLAQGDLKALAAHNPIAVERVLALCAGEIHDQNWFKVENIDSCTIDQSEVIRRLTFCQDADPTAISFRSARLKRCKRLWTILSDAQNLPTALKSFSGGYQLSWSETTPHQNLTSNDGEQATVIYMGEDVPVEKVDKVKTLLAEALRKSIPQPEESRAARQRLAVWYRGDNDAYVLHRPHDHVRIDDTSDSSEMDIGRAT